MQRHKRISSIAIYSTTFLLVLGFAAEGDVVQPGIDIWQTNAGGGSVIDIPANFFGCSHAAFTVPAEGVPIVSDPANELGLSDTVLERADGVNVPPSSGSTNRVLTGVKIVALHLTNTNVISACGESWNVDATLGDRTQTEGDIFIGLNANGVGGTYTASFDVAPFADVTSTTGAAPFSANLPTITIATSGAGDWAPHPGTGGVEAVPSTIDSNGDGTPDLAVLGTGGFAPGWLCLDSICQNPAESPPPHDGPHAPDPPQPPPGC